MSCSPSVPAWRDKYRSPNSNHCVHLTPKDFSPLPILTPGAPLRPRIVATPPDVRDEHGYEPGNSWLPPGVFCPPPVRIGARRATTNDQFSFVGVPARVLKHGRRRLRSV